MRQPFGIVHGGAYAAIAETLASVATFMFVAPNGKIADGPGQRHELPAPGLARARSTPTRRRRHRGRTTWVWDVEFTDDEGRLCAVTRVTIAVRPAPATQ